MQLGVLMDGQRHAFLRVPLYKPSGGRKGDGGPGLERCLDAEGAQSAISFTLQYLE